VRRDELLNIVSPIGRAAGIHVQKAESLPALELAWNGLDAFLTSKKA
jgi:hypothetical protein